MQDYYTHSSTGTTRIIDTHTAAVRPSRDGAAFFTSTKCPPGPQQSCALPFGFIWTPFERSSSLTTNNKKNDDHDAVPVIQCVRNNNNNNNNDESSSSAAATTTRRSSHNELPPILCLTCLSYLNLYAEIVEDNRDDDNEDDDDDKTNDVDHPEVAAAAAAKTTTATRKQWICPLCESPNVLPPGATEKGSPLAPLFASPVVELRQDITGRVVTQNNIHNNTNTTAVVGEDDPTKNNNNNNNELLSDDDSTTVVLVLDANLAAEEAKAIGCMLQTLLSERREEKNKSILHLGLIIFGKTVSVYQLGVSGMAVADVICAHPINSSSGGGEKDDHEDDQYLLSSSNKPYHRTIRSVADLDSVWQCLAAHYGIPIPTQDELLSMQRQRHHHHQQQHDPATAAAVVEISQARPKSRLEMLRQRKEDRLRDSEQKVAASPGSVSPPVIPNKSPWTAAKENAPWTQPLRCTGEAIQCAIDLASMLSVSPPPRTARIFLFTNGCPNYGPGSVVADTASLHDTGIHHHHHHHQHKAPYVIDSHQLVQAKEYFDNLAKMAAEGGVGMDVLCTGASELGIPAYQALVEPSSGYVLSHDSFVTPHLTNNMKFLWNETFMSGVYAEEMQDRNWIDGCMLDLRMVGFIEPTHLVGTGEFVEDPSGTSRLLPNEKIAFAAGAAEAAQANLPTQELPNEDIIDATLTRIRLGRFDPMATFSVMLQLHDVLPDDEFAIFQCIARYVDESGKTLVTRISTHRLAVAKDVSEFLDSVDEEVVPVLLGKEAVYRSMYGREVDGNAVDAVDNAELDKLAYDAQTDIDATVQQISGAFRLLGLEEGTRALDLTEEGQARATGTSMDFAFPPELREALRRIYHLRRGPLISPGPLQSIDDRAEKRSLFVRFPLQHCLSMMAPSIWTSGPLNPDEKEVVATLAGTVPAETLVLWSNCVIAADHYDNLFVWSGSDTRGVAYDEIRRQFRALLLQESKDRFPMPKLHIVSENDSMSRRFTSLLSPSHADPAQHQMAHFPALEQLSEVELNQLRSKFRFHDPNVDPSFRQWFWNVSSAAKKGRGISLCE